MPIRIPTHLTDSQLISELTRCTRDERVASAVLIAHLAEMKELTAENHQELIAAASGLAKRAVAELLAQRFPKPDMAPLVRKLPTPAAPPIALAPPSGERDVAVPPPAPPVRVPSLPPPLATPLSADRCQIRFTASTATWEKLRVARDLLRHVVPSGDPSEIFDRALTALIAEHAKKKIAAVAKPALRGRATAPGSRHVPARVRRAVWARDRGQCAFVAASGRRCQERGRLEFHHVHPYAAGGEATVANIQLRCRAHNAYEAVLFYGPNVVGLSARGSTAPGSGDHVRAAGRRDSGG